MKSKDITVLIRTIGRDSLLYSIESAKKEFYNVIVVADGFDLNIDILPKEVIYLKNESKIDQYGGAAINLGAEHCQTKYLCLLDDDDEFILGAGKYMQRSVALRPEIDIWIPGLIYNDGSVLCVNPGLFITNVAVPTYKTDLLKKVPFSKKIGEINPDCTDFYHVQELINIGAKIDWYQKELYNVRPRLNGKHGRGSNEV
jgi:glycosyltransferase involved in cell wall biosynthesis